MLVDEQSRPLDDPDLKKWADSIGAKFGFDILAWPNVGCGKMFVPHETSPFMVAGIRIDDGEWAALSSDRIPQKPSDAIKPHYAHFFMASQTLNPEALKDIISTAFPMTHSIKGCG